MGCRCGALDETGTGQMTGPRGKTMSTKDYPACECGCKRFTQVIFEMTDRISFGKYKGEEFAFGVSWSYKSWAIGAGAIGPCRKRSSSEVVDEFRQCTGLYKSNKDYDYDDYELLWDFGLTQG